VIIDFAVYRDVRRLEVGSSVVEAKRAIEEDDDAFACVELFEPREVEFADVWTSRWRWTCHSPPPRPSPSFSRRLQAPAPRGHPSGCRRSRPLHRRRRLSAAPIDPWHQRRL